MFFSKLCVEKLSSVAPTLISELGSLCKEAQYVQPTGLPDRTAAPIA